jgi:voltage-gated potassium channel Kch
MAAPAETTLIVLGTAAAGGLVSPQTATFWEIVTALGLTITPMLAQAGRTLSKRVERRSNEEPLPPIDEGQPRVLIIGFGRVGRLVAQMLDAHKRAYLAIDADADLVAAARERLAVLEHSAEELEAIRAALTPATLPDLPDVDAAAAFVPSEYGVSGDFYLLTNGPDDSTIAVVGDVVGHGPKAARLATFIRARFAAFAANTSDPAEILTLANAALVERPGRDEELVSAVCLRFQAADSSLSYAVAGHPPPLHLPTLVEFQPEGATLLLGLLVVILTFVSSAVGNLLGMALRDGDGSWALGLTACRDITFILLTDLVQGLAYGMLLLISAAAIVAFYVLPNLSGILFGAVPALKEPGHWLDLNQAQGALYDHHVSGQQWAQVLTATLLWVILPAVFGVRRVLRTEVKSN